MLKCSLMQGLDLDLPPGKSMLIVGPSGCGKSSLLRAISGEAPSPVAIVIFDAHSRWMLQMF